MPISIVTGANGFVGSHLVDYLLEKGEEVHCIIRKTSNTQWLDDKPVILHRCGLTRTEDLRPIMQKADYIYHIAGVISSKTSEGFYQGNVETTRNLLEAAIGAPNLKRITVTSSLAAVGSTDVGNPLVESAPYKPLNNYGKSKKQQEELLHTYTDRLPITIIRPPAVYGPRDSALFVFFNTVNSGLFSTAGFSKKTLSLVHSRDLVHGIWLAANKEVGKGATYFISSQQAEYEWPHIARLSKKAVGRKVVSIRVPHAVIYGVGAVSQFLGKFKKKPPILTIEKAQEIAQPSWSCSPQKAVEELGYEEAYSLETGIPETITWYKENGWMK